MIIADMLCLQYPDGTMALENISLQVKGGELLYILGPSGSGKTSLLKLLMGIESPTKGSLHVLDQPINRDHIKSPSIRALRRKIGPVFQDFKLINGRSALENVMLGMRFLGMSPSKMRNDGEEALIKVGLGHKSLSLVENLSWGERQRVSIARAVARRPQLILADEPTGNLDKDNSLKILELLASFRDENTSVVITTHATHLIGESKNYRGIHLSMGSILDERVVSN